MSSCRATSCSFVVANAATHPRKYFVAPNRALDGTFGTGGIVATPTNGEDARAVAVQPDGRIVVAGGYSVDGEPFAVRVA